MCIIQFMVMETVQNKFMYHLFNWVPNWTNKNSQYQLLNQWHAYTEGAVYKLLDVFEDQQNQSDFNL